MNGRLPVEIEAALGPGVDFESHPSRGLVGVRARHGGIWLGFDRAALLESDDGLGRRVPVLVAVPVSTYVGCRLEVETVGGWQTARGSILVARLQGTTMPASLLARVAAAVDEAATWLDRDAAERIALLARQRYRERRSHARITGGRAWHAIGVLSPELARFATPHSPAEYSLARLPPRFFRGLEGLLDDDERLLYWIERPMVTDIGILERLRGRIDRRAALLALTDRQLLWIVDHAQPDKYLSDWGVDVEIVPLERLLEASSAERNGLVWLDVMTSAGTRAYPLPSELHHEVSVIRDLLARFTPDGAADLPRRRYALDPLPFDADTGARFGQARQAEALHERATQAGEVLGFLFSPSRPEQRSPAALVLRLATIELLAAGRQRAVPLADVIAAKVTLSALVGRVSTVPGVSLTYPAPLMDPGAAFVRLTRRAMAMAT
jgi:hypothetical protein